MQKTGVIAGIARKSSSRSAMELINYCTITCAEGVENDFRGLPGNRQVTLLSRPAWRAVCQELDAVGLEWTTRRANLLIDGLEFGPQDLGSIVEIGDVRMEITLETDPCNRMDEQVSGLKAALAPDWRGGVCCKVIHNGLVRLGDTITIKN